MKMKKVHVGGSENRAKENHKTTTTATRKPDEKKSSNNRKHPNNNNTKSNWMALDSNATTVVESMDSNDTGGAVSDGGDTTSDTPSTGVARVRNGKAVKRKHSVTDDNANKVNNGQAQKKRVKRNGETVDKGPQTKNTVALLNELRKNVVYEVESQSGPVHAPVFTMSVLVDGQKYYGKGRSKKLARAEAAAVALRDFVQFKDSTAALALTPNDLKHVDFTSDEQLENEISKSLAAQAEQGKNVCEKGPVMLLHEIFNDAQFECLSSDGPQHSKFKVQVLVNSGRFEGTGPSKKAARNAAAKAALATLCNISYSPMQQTTVAVPKLPNELGKNVELPQTFADVIGKLVLDKFSEIMKGNETYARRKVLAGFVMTRGADTSSAQVICVSTGTKCINGEHLSVSGSVVNDCHAEIVSRRCLMFFFYQQLALHTTGNAEDATESVFQAPRNGGHLYKLKPEIQFHLYINTAPCGDARVFSPHEADTVNGDKHPNRKARGQLRTKVESGEGTIPVKSSEGIQTWDGVLQGSRLLTMSCSDKIARWNVLGVQGSLLASIIEPIYLTSIVLGSLLHPDHMYRAICGRIENAVQGLPPPYRMNKPKLALMTSSEARSQIKAPNFSVNWVIGQEEVEIVNAFTGRPEVGSSVNRTSRLAKQMFFQRYANLARELPDIQAKDLNIEYGDIKTTVSDYQMAKKELFGAFQREDFGLWLKKPIEQDQFILLDLTK